MTFLTDALSVIAPIAPATSGVVASYRLAKRGLQSIEDTGTGRFINRRAKRVKRNANHIFGTPERSVKTLKSLISNAQALTSKASLISERGINAPALGATGAGAAAAPLVAAITAFDGTLRGIRAIADIAAPNINPDRLEAGDFESDNPFMQFIEQFVEGDIAPDLGDIPGIGAPDTEKRREANEIIDDAISILPEPVSARLGPALK